MLKKLIHRLLISRYIGSGFQTILNVLGTYLITNGVGNPDDINAAKDGLMEWLGSSEFSTWLGSILLGGGLLASMTQDKVETKNADNNERK